jgi:hypothetical protein
MAKLNGNFNVISNNKSEDTSVRAPRDTFAVVNEKGVSLITNLNGDDSWYQNDSIVDSALEAVIDKVESIPENTAEIISKPVRILLPRSISGLANGNLIDYIRTGKTVSGTDLPKERIESMCKLMKLMSTRYANVELVADNNIRKEERDNIVAKAWDTFKEEISKATRRGFGAEPVQQVVVQKVEFDDSKLKEYQAKLNDLEDALIDAEDEAEETKLERKIAKVQKAIDRQYAMLQKANGIVTSEETSEEPTTEESSEPEISAAEAELIAGM